MRSSVQLGQTQLPLTAPLSPRKEPAKPVSWAIFGTGRVAHEFASGLKMLSGVQLVGVAGRSPAKAASFARTHQAGQAYASAEAMFLDPRVDVIYIATPPHRHSDDCVRALQHGKAVLCEKPFTVNAAEARRVIAAARQHNTFLMEAMWMRFMPLLLEIRDLVHSGAIGQPTMITADFGYPVAPDAAHHLFQPETGGGALLDRGVYLLSLCQLLFGKPEHVASQATIGASGVDEQCAIQLRYSSGILASLTASLTGLARNEAMIMGSAGTINIHAPFYKPHHYSLKQFTPAGLGTIASEGGRGFPVSWLKRQLSANRPLRSLVQRSEPLINYLTKSSGRHTYKAFRGYGYQFEAAEVNRCLQLGLQESPLMPLSDTLAVMELMDGIRARWYAPATS